MSKELEKLQLDFDDKFTHLFRDDVGYFNQMEYDYLWKWIKTKIADAWTKEKPNYICKFVVKTIEEGGYTNYGLFEIIKEGNWLMLYNNLTDEWIDLKDLIVGEYLILEKE